jgi:MFS family permease
VIGAANAFDGTGWAIGPPVGGFLYSIGGFELPFFVVGPLPALLLCLQLLAYPRALPSPTAADGTAAAEQTITTREVVARARQLLTPGLLLTCVTGAVFT